VLLQFQGLDGMAKIWLNSQHVATVDNQFRSYSFNVKPFIVLGLNVLRISFQSPVKVAKRRANIYRVI
jgi:beta-mannosidase